MDKQLLLLRPRSCVSNREHLMLAAYLHSD